MFFVCLRAFVRGFGAATRCGRLARRHKSTVNPSLGADKWPHCSRQWPHCSRQWLHCSRQWGQWEETRALVLEPRALFSETRSCFSRRNVWKSAICASFTKDALFPPLHQSRQARRDHVLPCHHTTLPPLHQSRQARLPTRRPPNVRGKASGGVRRRSESGCDALTDWKAYADALTEGAFFLLQQPYGLIPFGASL